MNFRLRTSRKIENEIKSLQQLLNLQPYILVRLAVALSLRSDERILVENYRDNSGLEFNRSTITGEFDALFKAMIIEHTGHPLSDDEYFPSYFKAHLERGIPMLSEHYRYAGNVEKLITQLAQLG
ncbi:DndE family protein [Cohnella boryungensis]|uniref:DndE family protein n=1 Tax=Cohnella boryungensis TaxID=768479 RepID=A0ABV8SGF1_9BACL